MMRFLSSLVVLALAAVLVACGSSTVYKPFVPKRVVSFGDGLSDAGNTSVAGAAPCPVGYACVAGFPIYQRRFTVNDETDNPTWAETVAASYGLTLKASTAGGTGYALGNAKIADIAAQINTFKASNAITNDDLVLFNAGTRDLIDLMSAVAAKTKSASQATAEATQLGKDAAIVLVNLFNSGASHIGVINSFDLTKTPYAAASAQATAVGVRGAITAAYNDAFKTALYTVGGSQLGAAVRLVDIEYYTNLMLSAPTNYGLLDSTTVVCNGASVDPANGIGIGTNEANSSLCTTSTVVNASSYNSYFFADKIYPTPNVQRQIGNYVAGILKVRW